MLSTISSISALHLHIVLKSKRSVTVSENTIIYIASLNDQNEEKDEMMFDLRKMFAVPKNTLNLKNYCIAFWIKISISWQNTYSRILNKRTGHLSKNE